MIAWQERAQSAYITRKVKNKYSNIALTIAKFSMMYCFGGFRYNEWAVGYVCMHTLTKGKHKTRHSMHFPYNPINFCNFSFLTLPPIYSPYTRPSETILTNKVSIERQINRIFRDI